MSGRMKKTTEQFKKEVYSLAQDNFLGLSEYTGSTNKIKMKHNTGNCNFEFEITPAAFLTRKNCPLCTNRRTFVGHNDLHTKNPSLAQYLYDYKDGYKNYGSGEKVKWKCPECGEIFERSISDMVKRGFSCPKCSDGISYPNKFMYNILEQVSGINKITKEYRPNWCQYTLEGKNTFGKYDVYFEFNHKQYIVELDGGLGHGNRTIDKTPEQSLIIDTIKDKLAMEHGIEVIRINADYGKKDRFNYLREQIKKSKLSSIIDLSQIDFDEANKKSLNSYIASVAKLWNSGKTPKEIRIKLNLSETTITNYLKLGKKCGLCPTYSKEESKKRADCHKIYCLTTNEVFDSIAEASRVYNIFESCISKCCRRKCAYGGEYNGEKMVWLYYEDYVKLSDEQLKNYVAKKQNNVTKVICLNTLKTFDSIKEAAIYYGIRASGIQACCSKNYKYSGIDKKTGEKLLWKYYDEYLLEKEKVG